MKIVTISVAQDDIDCGDRFQCGHCPLAIAMTRTLGRQVHVWGEWEFVDENDDVNAPLRKLPGIAHKWMGDFDHGVPVQPFEFELEVAA